MRYCPFYCEENVWHLCAEPRFAGREGYAVFISNARRTCPLWAQRAAPSPAEPVIWDYHVIFVAAADDGRWEVWDPDSRLGAPVALDAYLAGTFPLGDGLPVSLRPRFRVVPRETFVERFASDRSHMRDAAGRWLQPPPPWPPIGDGGSNLARFIDVEGDFLGETLDLEGLRARFTPGPGR